MSLVDREDVPEAKSSRSTSAVLRARDRARANRSRPSRIGSPAKVGSAREDSASDAIQLARTEGLASSRPARILPPSPPPPRQERRRACPCCPSVPRSAAPAAGVGCQRPGPAGCGSAPWSSTSRQRRPLSQQPLPSEPATSWRSDGSARARRARCLCRSAETQVAAGGSATGQMLSASCSSDDSDEGATTGEQRENGRLVPRQNTACSGFLRGAGAAFCENPWPPSYHTEQADGFHGNDEKHHVRRVWRNQVATSLG